MPRWGTVGSEQTHVRCANGFLRRAVSVSRRADIQRDRQRGIAPVNRANRSDRRRRWADPSLGRKTDGAVARRADADRSCVGGNDDVGAHPRDIVVPRRRRRGGIPNSRANRPAVGCQWADGPLGRKAKGADARCAVADRSCFGGIDDVGAHPQDIVVPRHRRRGGIPMAKPIGPP